MTSWWNGKLMQWQVGAMVSRWNGKLMKGKFDEMAIWWNEKFMKWQVDENASWKTASSQTLKLMRDQVVLTASWWIYKLTKCSGTSSDTILLSYLSRGILNRLKMSTKVWLPSFNQIKNNTFQILNCYIKISFFIVILKNMKIVESSRTFFSSSLKIIWNKIVCLFLTKTNI